MFGAHVDNHSGGPGEICAGSCEAYYHSTCHRITHGNKDDGDCSRGSLGRYSGLWGQRHDEINRDANKIQRHFR